MNTLTWSLQVVTALLFAAAGGMKALMPIATVRRNPRMGWTEGFSDGAIKAIGGAELLGAVGLIAPAATGILPLLTPLAGAGLAALMGGAAATHARRGESPVGPIVLGVLAVAAAVLRFRLLGPA